MESKVLRDLGKESGLVIATGGGCVTRQENYRSLHQNGTIVWLRRDLQELPTDGRPISQKLGVQKLYEQRKPLYKAFSDMIVDNDISPDDTVEKVLKQLQI